MDRFAAPGFREHLLEDGNFFYIGQLPESFCLEGNDFERLWDLHPTGFHEIIMHGRQVKTPRWQQAYGADYHYTG